MQFPRRLKDPCFGNKQMQKSMFLTYKQLHISERADYKNNIFNRLNFFLLETTTV